MTDKKDNGNYSSDGNYHSHGLKKCKGNYRSIFCIGEISTPKIFGVDVSEKRAKEVLSKLYDLYGQWRPQQTNAFELYIKSGSDWSKVKGKDINPICQNGDQTKVWEGMPQPAVDYIKSLPEFNAGMFKEITGISVSDKVKIVCEGKEVEISRDSAIALGLLSDTTRQLK